MPREPVQGAAAVLPWLILAGGLVVAALGGALGLNAARRARAQEELDRIFTHVSGSDRGCRLRRTVHACQPGRREILGYTEEELLARPYVDLVHPADRDSTAAEADAIARGKPTVSFENRYVRKDGSVRVLDWTTTPDVENRLMYAVARDVTERRNAEAEVERLADEQAALRRVATLVARGGRANCRVRRGGRGDGGSARRRPGRTEPHRARRRDSRARPPRAGRGANARRLAVEPRGRERHGNGPAHRAADPDGELRGSSRPDCGARPGLGSGGQRRGTDSRGRPALGDRHGELEG